VPAKDQVPSNRWRLPLFHLIAVLLPVLYFVVLEGSLRVFNYGDDLDLFIPTPGGFSDKELLAVNPGVGKRYFGKGTYYPRPLNDYFLKHKPDNDYRIFVLGESTTAAYPYPANVAFSRILKQRLADAFPDRTIEVVNLSMAAINSYTMLDFMDEVLAHQPDAILIYSGHNEFYGAMGVASSESFGKFRPVIRVYMSLQRFKTIELFENVIAGLKRWIGSVLRGNTPGNPYATLMGRVIREKSIPYGSSDYETGVRQFRSNLQDIFRKAKEAGVPVVISEVVSNVRDHPPFVSIHSASSHSADNVYRTARTLEEDGDYEQARAAYYRAKDLDAMRFRASEEFNGVIHQIAARFKAPVVPMKEYFEASSPHGLIGHNLMLEHLHPNVEGQFLMSEAFFDVLRRNRMIAAKWNESLFKPREFYREHWPITEFDRTLGALRIRFLTDHWPFKPLESSGRGWAGFQPEGPVETLAFKVEKGEMSFLEGHMNMASQFEALGQYDDALREYQALAAADPHDYRTMLTIAKRLIELKQAESAMPFLYGSVSLKETPCADRLIRQLYLHDVGGNGGNLSREK
jgi:tetratricopeptide (TPR) repeat protein